MVGRALSAYGVGLIGLILIKILTPGFYAKQDIKTPVKIGIVVLIVTQISNYFRADLRACRIDAERRARRLRECALLFIGLRKRGIYQPSAGWLRFFVQLLGACLVLAGVMHWVADQFRLDRHACRAARPNRASRCVPGCVRCAIFRYALAMGFKYAYFRRRMQ